MEVAEVAVVELGGSPGCNSPGCGFSIEVVAAEMKSTAKAAIGFGEAAVPQI